MKNTFKFYWTHDGSRKGPMKKGLSVLPFPRPSVCPDVFFELNHYFFLNFGMVLETLMKSCVAEPDFWENGQKMAQKQGF